MLTERLYSLRSGTASDPVVLEALKRRPAREGGRRDGADGRQNPDESILHWSDPSWFDYQPLRACSGNTLVPPSGLRDSLRKRENRPDTMVGRLHYSLGPTLSAHFRWSVGASERLNFAS